MRVYIFLFHRSSGISTSRYFSYYSFTYIKEIPLHRARSSGSRCRFHRSSPFSTTTYFSNYSFTKITENTLSRSTAGRRHLCAQLCIVCPNFSTTCIICAHRHPHQLLTHVVTRVYESFQTTGIFTAPRWRLNGTLERRTCGALSGCDRITCSRFGSVGVFCI